MHRLAVQKRATQKNPIAQPKQATGTGGQIYLRGVYIQVGGTSSFRATCRAGSSARWNRAPSRTISGAQFPASSGSQDVLDAGIFGDVDQPLVDDLCPAFGGDIRTKIACGITDRDRSFRAVVDASLGTARSTHPLSIRSTSIQAWPPAISVTPSH